MRNCKLDNRFGQQAINYITNLLCNDFVCDTKNFALIFGILVLIALRFLASSRFLQVIGDTFGVDKSTELLIVCNVCLALSKKQEQFICWPSNKKRETIKNGVYNMVNFPGVIGCINCTHILIQAPHLSDSYNVNRKCCHFIIALAICDH